MSVEVVDICTLDEINSATKALSDLMIPLITQLDLALTGSFGLGALERDISAELDASLSMKVDLQVQIVNPIEALKQALEAAVQLQASITATLALGLPVVSADFDAQVSASAAASATLAAKLAGIQGVINAALAVKFPALDFLQALLGNLSVGPVVLLSFGVPFDTLSSVGTQLDALFQAGIPAMPPHAGLPPDQPVYGIVLLTGAPLAWAAIQAILRTS